MKVSTWIASLAAAGLTAGSASAAITGQFVDFGTVNGAQVYGFEITSTADVLGLDFSAATGGGFGGNFNNTGIDTDFDTIPDSPLTFTPAAPQPGPLQESYFAFSPTGLITVNVDDFVGPANFLGAAFTLDGGGTLVAANTPTIVAYFSTSDGLTPTFLGGEAETTAGFQQIVIPEPASLVLAALGLVALGGRRRHANA